MGDGRRDPGSGPGTGRPPPGQPQHELIKRHQRRSNLCLGGRSRKTHSSSQPSTVMARTLQDAAPRQRALAHPSRPEHHSYPPQPCFCQMPKPSPAELLTAPATPCGRHAPPVWVIPEALTGRPCPVTGALPVTTPNPTQLSLLLRTVFLDSIFPSSTLISLLTILSLLH